MTGRWAAVAFASVLVLPEAACSGRGAIVDAPRPAASPEAPAPSPSDAGAPQAVADASSAPLPPPEGAIGTAHPVTVEAASPDGKWVVACQARSDTDGDGKVGVTLGPHGRLRGDAMRRYYVAGTGPGEPIDSLVASSPSGRHLAVIAGGRLALRDALAGTDTDLSALGADVRDDRTTFGGHRAGSFDPAGKRFLYLRKKGRRTVAIVRSLEDASEVAIDPGAVELWRASFGPAGQWVVLRVIGDDTNGNGRLDWPAPVAKAPRGCRGPTPPHAAWLGRGDTVTKKVARVTGGTVWLKPSLVTPFGDRLIVREQSGRLLLDALRGKRELSPEKCQASLLHADPRRGIAVASCGDSKLGPVTLQLLGVGLQKDLGLQLAAVPSDVLRPAVERLLPVYPGDGTALIDLKRRSVVSLKNGDRVLATHGDRALIERGRSLLIREVPSRDLPLDGEVHEAPDILGAGPAAVVSPLVIDLGRGKTLGRVSGRPLAVTTGGSVLVAAGSDADADRLAVGPLAWRTPTPLAVK